MNFLLQASTESSSDKWSVVIDTIVSWCFNTGIKIIISLLILFISFRIINATARKIQNRLNKSEKADKTLVKTLSYIGKTGAKIIVVICLVGYLGIDTSGLTALVTSLGVCAGLAVNGALSNLAGGVIILFTRPFRVDDYIEVVDGGISGTVEDIQIVCTKLRTPDNKVIYAPNGTLSNSNIINYSEKDTRRVDFSFDIAYDNDFEMAKQLVASVCASHELALADPAPMVRVSEHGQSSIKITARVWVKNDDYWTVKFDVLERVKKLFDESGITIPYNQLDVHLKND
ncbi:MAG: mechanosensitive ion channel [Clostridia bacterium]|nr:mechanosensitive ion channel [Clostridia bacterium]